ncbi:MAG: serine/threonine-protein kinase [Planctomycetota bacterium]
MAAEPGKLADSTRFAQIERVFHAALRLPTAERADYVRRALPEDQPGQAEVLELLTATEQATTFLETPLDVAAVGTVAPEDAGLPGRMVGPYRLIREIGRGGMGIVYEAEQAWPKRRVALKVVHGTPGDGNRFLHEPRVLGRLNHPYVATIYDASQTPEGVAYFVMELIEGQRLDEFAEKRNLPRRERLRLFCKVCEAIQHAHMKSVIHLDLKPSNILVLPPKNPKIDDVQVKVVDFGIAAITGSDTTVPTRLGATGALPGTLAYMSPEQRRGERDAIDVRTDVYALGVVLFKLMTGELPYPIENVTFAQAWQILSNGPPRRPRGVNPHLPPDIDTIIRAATAEEPARRYQSVAELAGDVHRYLSDLPIAARPPSKFYEWSKFARRNKELVGTLAALLLGLAGTTIGTSLGLARARAAEERWRDEASQNELLSNLFADVLLDEFADRPAGSSPGTSDLTPDVMRRRGALQALESWRRKAEQKVKTGQAQLAAEEYARLVKIGRLLAGSPGHWYLAQLLGEYGECLVLLRRYEEAQRWLQESYQIASETMGAHHVLTQTAAKRLAALYTAWSKPDLAGEWKQRWRAIVPTSGPAVP